MFVALDIDASDAKALYRRAQARTEMGNTGEAFKDAKRALHIQPKNNALKAMLAKLVRLNQKKVHITCCPEKFVQFCIIHL